jgi:hypothetical protein
MTSGLIMNSVMYATYHCGFGLLVRVDGGATVVDGEVTPDRVKELAGEAPCFDTSRAPVTARYGKDMSLSAKLNRLISDENTVRL